MTDVEYECGCFFGPDDPCDAACPLHNLPMKLNTIEVADLEWAYRELSKHGTFGVEDCDD